MKILNNKKELIIDSKEIEDEENNHTQKFLVEYCVKNHISLKFANLENANLENADLEGANLTNADLNKTNLKFANLEDTNFKNAYFAYKEF